jgi:hypothetical protein
MSVVTSRLRLKSVVFLAALYTFMVLTPHLALAFSATGGFSHCLTPGKLVHEHSVAHVEAHVYIGSDMAPTPDDTQGFAGVACCGLFSATAVVCEMPRSQPPRLVVARPLPFPSNCGDGQGPGRISRPPIG